MDSAWTERRQALCKESLGRHIDKRVEANRCDPSSARVRSIPSALIELGPLRHSSVPHHAQHKEFHEGVSGLHSDSCDTNLAANRSSASRRNASSSRCPPCRSSAPLSSRFPAIVQCVDFASVPVPAPGSVHASSLAWIRQTLSKPPKR